MRAIFFLLSLLALAGCPSPETHGQFPTDTAMWTLELDTEWPTGWVDIAVMVLDAEDAPQADLTLEADLTMPSMGHGSDEPITLSEVGDGVYNVHGHFQMEGPWELSGTLGDGEASDAFAVALDVVSE